MKTLLSKIGILSFLLSLNFTTNAYDFKADGIYYNINVLEKTAEVTFGDVKYQGQITIPSSVFYSNQDLPVTSISTSAFSNCSELLSVNIPNSVNSIGISAFRDCSNLISIELPNEITRIEDHTFAYCSSLKSIIIPQSVTSIGTSAFRYCSSLESIVLPDSVTEIGLSVFYECTKLTSVRLSNSLKGIESYTFAFCPNITSITIPPSVLFIGEEAFRNCISLNSVEIPNSVITINNYAFMGCENLSFIELGNTINKIGNYAFSYCTNLKSLNIPNSVKSIGNNAFLECTNLEITVIGSSVESIGYNAFKGCISLNQLSFADSDTVLHLIYENGQYVSFSDSPIEDLYLGRNIEESEEGFKSNSQIKTLTLGKYVIDAEFIYPQKNENLEVINCYNPDPPKIREFSNVQYVNIVVNIPLGSIEKYQKNSIWCKFWNIQETLPSPIIEAEEIVLNIESKELNIGETIQLDASVLPENTTDKTLTWNSSDPNIATVSDNGLVKAISTGLVIITAACGEVSAECVITVLEDAGIESLLANPDIKISIYSTDGILIKKDYKIGDLKTLNKGIYIIVSGKERYKILI